MTFKVDVSQRVKDGIFYATIETSDDFGPYTFGYVGTKGMGELETVIEAFNKLAERENSMKQ